MIRREFERQINILIQTDYESDIHLLAFLDLDNFKIINDTYGHKVGDDILKYFVQSIKQFIRHSDQICRMGGDEFSIIFRNCSSEQALHVCQTIHEFFNTHHFKLIDKLYHIRCSMGIIEFSNEPIEDILSNADNACYIAKEQGKNQIKIFDHHKTLFTKRRDELHIYQKLMSIIEEEGHLQLFVQPIMCVSSICQSHICKIQKQQSRICKNFEMLIRILDEGVFASS